MWEKTASSNCRPKVAPLLTLFLQLFTKSVLFLLRNFYPKIMTLTHWALGNKNNTIDTILSLLYYFSKYLGSGTIFTQQYHFQCFVDNIFVVEKCINLFRTWVEWETYVTILLCTGYVHETVKVNKICETSQLVSYNCWTDEQRNDWKQENSLVKA